MKTSYKTFYYPKLQKIFPETPQLGNTAYVCENEENLSVTEPCFHFKAACQTLKVADEVCNHSI